VDTFLAPPPLKQRGAISIAVDPASNRLQLLEPFKAWNGSDYTDLAILIKVCSMDEMNRMLLQEGAS
jgi:aconitate hydratase